MADPFATAARSLHASVLAVAAAYTPIGGETYSDPFRVIRSKPDVEADFGGGRVVLETDSLAVLVADLPDRPSYGDRFDLLDDNGDPIESLSVNAAVKLDVEGVSWIVPVGPA